ncbi:MAG: NAD-dependent protein deacylase, partial [Lachnospiraceae bacterium]
MTEMEQLQQWIHESDNIVFFGGAGVSTESGIPDFRSVDGLYHQTYRYPPETILSHTFYRSHTEAFFDFYRAKMLCLTAKPNAAHLKLAELERAGKLRAVITQNIDGLHQAAGSKNVLELHGSVLRNYCEQCGQFYDADYVQRSTGVPKCSCGGTVKPDVVLY